MSIADKLTAVAENTQKVYEAGQKAEYDRFWDAYQKNGTRDKYRGAFAGDAWAASGLLPPKYPMVLAAGVTTQTSMFEGFNVFADDKYNNPYDMTEICKMIDFSQCTHATMMFCNAVAKNITCDFSNLINMNQTFACSNGGYVENITLKVTEKLTSAPSAFVYCYNTKNITFTEDSTIACNFDFSHSTLLTHDSLMSIINALQDKKASGGSGTITLGSTNLAKLTDAEKAIATEKGWTLV